MFVRLVTLVWLVLLVWNCFTWAAEPVQIQKEFVAFFEQAEKHAPPKSNVKRNIVQSERKLLPRFIIKVQSVQAAHQIASKFDLTLKPLAMQPNWFIIQPKENQVAAIQEYPGVVALEQEITAHVGKR